MIIKAWYQDANDSAINHRQKATKSGSILRKTQISESFNTASFVLKSDTHNLKSEIKNANFYNPLTKSFFIKVKHKK